MVAEQYITLEDLKSFMEMDSTDTSKDTILKFYVDGINAEVRKKIGRYIFAKDYVEKYKGTSTVDLILEHRPINSVTAVEFVQNGTVYEALESYEYDINSEAGILEYDGGWSLEGSSSYMSGKIDYPRKHIRVTYNAGFAETPGDLKLMLLQVASDTYNFDNSQGTLLTDYKISDVSMSFKTDIRFSERQMQLITSYKGVRF